MRTDFGEIKVDIMSQEIEIRGEKFKLWEVYGVNDFSINNLRILEIILSMQGKSCFGFGHIYSKFPDATCMYIIQDKEKYECFLKDIAEAKTFVPYMKSPNEHNVMRRIISDAGCKYHLDMEIFKDKIEVPTITGDGHTSIPIYRLFTTIFAFGIDFTRFDEKIFCENDFDEVKELFIRLRSEGINNLKNEKILQDIINLVDTYKKIYGDNLEGIAGIWDKYLGQKDWRKICESIDNEINLLKYGIEHHIGEESNIRVIMRTLVSIKETMKKDNEYNENKANGMRGEKEVDYALKWLDKSYICISRLSDDGHGNKCIIISNPEFIDEPQEYDHIVVGKQGIFLIETKNYAGKLIVDKYGNWIRIKQDGTEEGERNPIQQVRRHEKMLRSIIPEDIEIIDIICMAHPKMIIEGIENCAIPLIKSDMLVEYIENYDNGKMLSDGEVRDCADRIKEYMK